MVLGGLFAVVGAIGGVFFLLIAIGCLVTMGDASSGGQPKEKPKVVDMAVERADSPASPSVSVGPAPASAAPKTPVASPDSRSNTKEGAVMGAIFCGALSFGFFSLMGQGTALIRKRKRVQHYIELIVNRGITRVDEIAVASGRSDFNKVMAEIQGLIKEGFLPGYRLDVEERLVIHHGSHAHTPEEVGFTCKSCGANNMVLALGGFIRCEYCGTPVKVAGLT